MAEKKVVEIKIEADVRDLLLLQQYITEIQSDVSMDKERCESVIVRDTLHYHVMLLERLYDSLSVAVGVIQ